MRRFGVRYLWILLLLWGLLLSWSWTTEAADRSNSNQEQAELRLTAAMIANVAYNGELKTLTRNWLMARGWQVYSYRAAPGENGRLYVFAHRFQGKEIFFLTFPGTETMQDAKLDLRVNRVPFGGHSPAEFARQAADLSQKSGSKPLVHRGFNDYVQQLLFTQSLPQTAGLTWGEAAAQELIAHPQRKVYLTGHSLGGAAATLTAARLSDLGVSPHQLEVITFGAPAVGNEAFARAYEHKFSLTRIGMEGDPVKSVLQSLTGGFVQFGQRVDWKSKFTEHFPHEMVLYLDEAWRHYVDAKPAGDLPRLAGEAQLHLERPLYVAKPSFALPKNLRGERKYMERMVRELTEASYMPQIQAEAKKDFSALQEEARTAGCGYILCQQYTCKRIRREKENYRLTLEEVIYDTDGNVCYLQSRSTTTKEMTPVQAAAYLHVQGEEDRAQALHVGAEYKQLHENEIVDMNTECSKNSEK
ncbi:MAG: lipase family protein [Selenomonas sp.]|uniref:lipase family protein n=1 Tax=Selenomonas sp. TaxID=2053611 RepID=UPI0025EAB892|nr:lipase family protein [Selenomonas sp.]MCR5758708.1 lipase family protein [Selenomonas sp.]